MKKFAFIILSLLLTVTLLVGCQTKTEDNRPVIKVGMECDYAPFNWTETKKSDSNIAIANVAGAYAQGYDVMIAKKIADELDMKLEIYAIAWNGLIPALTEGQIDLIIAGMSPTELRKETIDFTSTYYESTHVILLKKGNTYASATSLDALEGAKIAGQLGTLYADLVEQAVEHGAVYVEGTNMDTVPKLVNEIKQGTIDGTILEEPVAKGITAADSSLTYITFASGQGFVVDDEDRIVSIGVRKEYELTDRINEILSSLTVAQRDELMMKAVELNS